MNRTLEYHKSVKAYRENLGAIWNEFDKKVAALERYKGSVGYDAELEKAVQDRDAAIKELQGKAYARFAELINGMKESARNRPLVAPTAEQMGVLQLLQMREKVTRDELEQAARTLKDNPAALSVLEEIAQKHDIHSGGFAMESTAGIMRHIDSLYDSAKRICALNKPNSKQEMVAAADIHSEKWKSNAMYSYRVDRDFDNEADTMAALGDVHSLSEFQNAVNQ